MRRWWWLLVTTALGCVVETDAGVPRQAVFDEVGSTSGEPLDDESSSGASDTFETMMDLGDAPEAEKGFIDVHRFWGPVDQPSVLHAGSVEEYASESCEGEVVKRHPNRCNSKTELEDFFTKKDGAACPEGQCCPELSSKKIDCIDACKAGGYYAYGECMTDAPPGEATIAWCDCNHDGTTDSDGRDPEVGGCSHSWYMQPACDTSLGVYDLGIESCGKGEKANTLHEYYVIDIKDRKPQAKDVCGYLMEEDVDCVAHCKQKLGATFESGACVKEENACQAWNNLVKHPSARCKCVAKP